MLSSPFMSTVNYSPFSSVSQQNFQTKSLSFKQWKALLSTKTYSVRSVLSHVHSPYLNVFVILVKMCFKGIPNIPYKPSSDRIAATVTESFLKIMLLHYMLSEQL